MRVSIRRSEVLKIGKRNVSKLEVVIGASMLLLILLSFLLLLTTIFGVPVKISNTLTVGTLIVGIPYFLCVVAGTLIGIPVFLYFLFKATYILFTHPHPFKKQKGDFGEPL